MLSKPYLSLLLPLLLCGCFPRSAGPRLAHFESQAPALGAPAPLFSLLDTEGRSVSLESLIGERPVVVQLGSHSCPVYRYRRHWMDDLVAQYEDRAHFLVVYTLEAHPEGSKSPYAEGEWNPWINRITGVHIAQPGSFEQRQQQAAQSRQELALAATVLVDEMSNEVWQRYGGAASPAFVIDLQGRIAARQVWIDPAELRRVLDRLLSPSDAP